MSGTDLLERIERAQAAINVAQSELDNAFKLMQTSAAGDEKIAISQVLGDAFEKLRDAKSSLVKIKEPKASLATVEHQENVEHKEDVASVEPKAGLASPEPKEGVASVEPKEDVASVEPKEDVASVAPKETSEPKEGVASVEPKASSHSGEPGELGELEKSSDSKASS